MSRAPAAKRSQAGTPFGAAHRVYFDTPPLKGLRSEPFRFHLGSCRNNRGCVRSAIFVVPFGTMQGKAVWEVIGCLRTR